MRVRGFRFFGSMAMTAATVVTAVTVGTAQARADDAADDTPPTIVDAGVADGARVSRTLALQPVVTDDVAVVRVTVTLGSYATQTRLSAPWRFGLSTEFISSGVFPVTVKAYDAAGNVAARVVQVEVDNQIPAPVFVSGLSDLHGMAATGVQFVPLPGDDGYRKVELYTGDRLLGTATAAPWVVTWDTSGFDGIVPLTARAYDALGNSRSSTRDAQVDNTGPVITYIFDRSTGYVHTGGSIFVSAVDRIDTAQVDLLVDGITVGSVAGRSYPTFRWPAHAAGPASMTIRATDHVGNVTELTRTVVVDDVPPTVTVAPAAGGRVRGLFAASVTGIGDESGFAALEVLFHGVTWMGEPGSRSVPIDTRGLPDGPYPIAFRVFDGAGNATTVQQTVIVDNHAPSVTFGAAPANRATLRKTVRITAKASDPYGVSRVQLLVNGKVVATAGKSPYAFTLRPGKYGKKFTVQLRAYDGAGNVSYSGKRTYRRR